MAMTKADARLGPHVAKAAYDYYDSITSGGLCKNKCVKISYYTKISHSDPYHAEYVRKEVAFDSDASKHAVYETLGAILDYIDEHNEWPEVTIQQDGKTVPSIDIAALYSDFDEMFHDRTNIRDEHGPAPFASMFFYVMWRNRERLALRHLLDLPEVSDEAKSKQRCYVIDPAFWRNQLTCKLLLYIPKDYKDPKPRLRILTPGTADAASPGERRASVGDGEREPCVDKRKREEDDSSSDGKKCRLAIDETMDGEPKAEPSPSRPLCP